MRKLLLWLVWATGLVAVLAGVCCAWFSVPVSLGTTPECPWEAVRIECSNIEPIFKVLVLIAISTAVYLYWQAARTKRARLRMFSATMATAALFATLMFPSCLIISQPQLVARATWIHLQHENLTWLGGDLFRNQEHERTPQQIQLFVSDSPREVTVLPLPTFSAQRLSLDHLQDLLEWLGFTNTFCQFVSAGWIWAVLGTMLLAISTTMVGRRADLHLIRHALRTSFALGLLGVIVAWTGPLLAFVPLTRAGDYAHRGGHALAVDYLESAARIWPPLRESTQFTVQHGLSDRIRGLDTPYAQFYVARLLEIDKQSDRAICAYRELASNQSAPSPIRREACRGVLRQAERSVNSGEWHLAIEHLNFVLKREPCDIKAIYAALICCVQLGDAHGAAQMHSRLTGIYHYMNYPNKYIVLGKSRELAAKAMLQQKNANEAFQQYSILCKQVTQSSPDFLRP